MNTQPVGSPTSGRSAHLVDPDLRPVIERFAQSAGVSAENLAETRAARVIMLAAAPPPPNNGVRVEERNIPGPPNAPNVRVLIYHPPVAGTDRPAVLHIHGGGYVMGEPAMADVPNRELSAALGCVVISVDYRLPPETPHPGPIEDCYAALKWISNSASELGVDRDRIAISGESAGGGLAASLAILARDRGGPSIAFQNLIYPMIDDRTATTLDPHPFVGEFVWTPETNRFGWTSLIGGPAGGPEVSPYAAAAREEDLAGLPPAFVAVGALDLFLEEDIEYVRRLSRAGVPVEFHVYQGAIHGFHNFVAANVTKRAMRDSRDALRRVFNQETS